MSDAILKVPNHEYLENLLIKANEQIALSDYKAVVGILEELHPADISHFLEIQNLKTMQHVIEAFDTIDPEILIESNPRVNEIIYETIGIKKFASLIEKMDVEDSLQVLSFADRIAQLEIINCLSEVTRLNLSEGLSYPEESVGRIMEKNFITLYNNQRVSEALNVLKLKKVYSNFYAVIIVDNKHKPLGYVLLSQLLQSAPEEFLMDIASKDLHSTSAYEQTGELIYIFKQYGLTIVPVVNKAGRLVGTVSIDSMLHIAEKQAENEILHLGGVGYQDTFNDLIDTVKNRFLWLFFNLFIAFGTAVVINYFSETILRFVALAAIMPIVASLGGNAGMQVMTVTIRALSNKDISSIKLCLRIIIKEFLVCTFNGVLISAIAMLITLYVYNDLLLSIIFAVSIVINFIIAGIMGSGVPIILDRMNIDPTSSSSVIVTAITDTFGLFCFLLLSYIFLM